MCVLMLPVKFINRGDNGALICDGETLIGDCEREDERLRPPRGVFVLLFELLLLYATENTAS